MGSQPTLVINFFAYFIPFYFISKVFESKLLFSLAFCLHFKNGYLVVWNRYDISHFPKCGWKDRRMDGYFFHKEKGKRRTSKRNTCKHLAIMLGIRIKREKKNTHTFVYFILFYFSRKHFPSKVLLDSFYYMAPNKQRNPRVCCARTKVSNERGWTTLNANG